jgi:hypothetical protein
MEVVKHRAGLLLVVLVLALAAGSSAQQVSREAHIQLQSSAKVSADMRLMSAFDCVPCSATQIGRVLEVHTLNFQDETLQLSCFACKLHLDAATLHADTFSVGTAGGARCGQA